ncbi:uncharacterized protein LOC124287172 [Haliotis rubra]|uniref:uncharacterized protein LOC124287172 n=1 Tax=Haliotis rubra TaxID=36100 RepID=UPI001EE622C6|nr:uncharacterized protein LOC124287172 [Haliotis rubra]
MLYNFVFFALSVLVSVSRGQECMQNAAMEMATCSRKLNIIGSEGAVSDVCREARKTLICMQRVLGDCPQLSVHMAGQMEMMENTINQQCPDVQTEAPETDAPETDTPETDAPEIDAPETDAPETDAPEIDALETEAPETDAPATDAAPRSRCSPNDANRIARCANRLQRFVGRSTIKCHKVRRTMNCLSKTMQRCPHLLDDRNNHIGTLRRHLLQVCVETNALPEEPTGEPQTGELGEEGEDEEEEEVEVCPADFMSRIQRCAEDMGNAMTSIGSGAADLTESCSSVTTSLDCVDDYVEACSDRPEIAQLTGMLNMDQTRSSVAQICPGAGTGVGPTSGPDVGPTDGPDAGSDEGPEEGDSECPADYEHRMQTCVKPLEKLNPQEVNAEVCGSANAALDCVDDVLNACRHTPHVQAFKNVLNMDGLRTMINDICTSGTLQPGPGVDANCPSDHSQKLISCVQPLQSLKQNPNHDLSEMCRVANTGFDCLDDIMGKCANQPDVRAMNSMLNVDNLREMINGQCPNAGTDAGPDEGPVEVAVANSSPGDTCNVADPADELLVCNRQLQKFASSSSSLRSRCGDLVKGLDCFDRLIASCPRHPSVVTFTDMLDMSEVRENLSGACPGRK